FCERAVNNIKEAGYFSFIMPNKFLSAPYGQHLKKFFSKYSITSIVDYSSVSVFVSGGKKINVYPVIIVLKKSVNNRNGQYFKMIEENNSVKCLYEKKYQINENDIHWTEKFDNKEYLISGVREKSVSLLKHFDIESAATVSESYEIKKLLEDKKRVT